MKGGIQSTSTIPRARVRVRLDLGFDLVTI
jgi:hypothetical protein